MLALLAARRVQLGAVRIAALWLAPVGLALFVLTVALAQRSF